MTVFKRRGLQDDPGPGWADSTLGSIRRQRFDPDVGRAVMARIAAERARPLRLPIMLRRPRLALAACVAGGLVSFGLVVAALVTLAINGDDGVRQIGTILSSAWHLFVVLGQIALSAGRGVLSAALAVGRGIWTVLEAGAPLFQGAGMVAAVAGLLSIPISFYILAQGYRAAPLIAREGEGGGPGGTR